MSLNKKYNNVEPKFLLSAIKITESILFSTCDIDSIKLKTILQQLIKKFKKS